MKAKGQASLIELRSITITPKGQIAIPKEVRKLSGFSEGKKVALLAFPDRIEIRPLAQLSERMFTALASEKSLAKDWNSHADDKAWKNL